MSGRGEGLRGMIRDHVEERVGDSCLHLVVLGRKFDDVSIGLCMVAAAKAKHASCMWIAEKYAQMARNRRRKIY